MYLLLGGKVIYDAFFFTFLMVMVKLFDINEICLYFRFNREYFLAEVIIQYCIKSIKTCIKEDVLKMMSMSTLSTMNNIENIGYFENLDPDGIFFK